MIWRLSWTVRAKRDEGRLDQQTHERCFGLWSASAKQVTGTSNSSTGLHTYCDFGRETGGSFLLRIMNPRR